MDSTARSAHLQTCGYQMPVGERHIAPGNITDPILVDSRTAARMLAISERKLWQLTKDGDIAHVRIGRSVRYEVADLHDAVERMKRKGGDS